MENHWKIFEDLSGTVDVVEESDQIDDDDLNINDSSDDTEIEDCVTIVDVTRQSCPAGFVKYGYGHAAQPSLHFSFPCGCCRTKIYILLELEAQFGFMLTVTAEECKRSRKRKLPSGALADGYLSPTDFTFDLGFTVTCVSQDCRRDWLVDMAHTEVNQLGFFHRAPIWPVRSPAIQTRQWWAFPADARRAFAAYSREELPDQDVEDGGLESFCRYYYKFKEIPPDQRDLRAREWALEREDLWYHSPDVKNAWITFFKDKELYLEREKKMWESYWTEQRLAEAEAESESDEGFEFSD